MSRRRRRRDSGRGRGLRAAPPCPGPITRLPLPTVAHAGTLGGGVSGHKPCNNRRRAALCVLRPAGGHRRGLSAAAQQPLDLLRLRGPGGRRHLADPGHRPTGPPSGRRRMGGSPEMTTIARREA
jgi:hypothetical protein